MARPGVTYEDVTKVTAKILRQGLNPTVARVREYLGTGSNTTISRHLEAWRETFDDEQTGFPESVPEELMNPLDEFWTTALSRAEANYQKFKQELEARIGQAEKEKKEAVSQLEENIIAFESLKQQLQDTNEQNVIMDRKLHRLEGENASLSKTVDMIRQETQLRIEKYDAQAGELEDNLVLFKEESLQKLSADREHFTVTENRHLNEIDSLRQASKKLKEDYDRFHQTYKKELQTAQNLINDLTEKHAISQQFSEDCQNQNITLKELIVDLQKERELVQSQLTQSQEQLTQSLRTVDSQHKTVENINNNELVLTQQVSNMKAQLTLLNTKFKDKDGNTN